MGFISQKKFLMHQYLNVFKNIQWDNNAGCCSHHKAKLKLTRERSWECYLSGQTSDIHPPIVNLVIHWLSPPLFYTIFFHIFKIRDLPED